MRISEICVVIYSHGKRGRFLTKVLSGLQSLDVGKVITVVSSADELSGKELENLKNSEVQSLLFNHNLGQGGGVRAGLEAAIQSEFDYYFILDDDLLPSQETFDKLIDFRTRQKQITKQPFALQCMRVDQFHSRKLFFRSGVLQITSPENGFLGFHISRFFDMLVYRTFKRNVPDFLQKPVIEMNAGFYGGLLIDRELLELIELPTRDYHIYVDDWEFTQQINAVGSQIFMLKNCQLTDLDQSIDYADRKSWFHHPVFDLKTDTRAYYYARNIAYFEKKWKVKSKWMYYLNKGTLLMLLFIMSLAKKRVARFNLTLRALSDAQNGKMGANPDFLY